SGLHRWACRLEPYLSWRSLAERRHCGLGVRGGLGKLPLAGHHTDAHGRPPQQHGSARSLKHFQQKCAAVLRRTMRRSEHFQQKCAAVLRRTMRRIKKRTRIKFVARPGIRSYGMSMNTMIANLGWWWAR